MLILDDMLPIIAENGLFIGQFPWCGYRFGFSVW